VNVSPGPALATSSLAPYQAAPSSAGIAGLAQQAHDRLLNECWGLVISSTTHHAARLASSRTAECSCQGVEGLRPLSWPPAQPPPTASVRLAAPGGTFSRAIAWACGLYSPCFRSAHDTPHTRRKVARCSTPRASTPPYTPPLALSGAHPSRHHTISTWHPKARAFGTGRPLRAGGCLTHTAAFDDLGARNGAFGSSTIHCDVVCIWGAGCIRPQTRSSRVARGLRRARFCRSASAEASIMAATALSSAQPCRAPSPRLPCPPPPAPVASFRACGSAPFAEPGFTPRAAAPAVASIDFAFLPSG
jgi:hypothetical protein